MFCGFCVEACPCDAIRMDTGMHAAPYDSREQFIFETRSPDRPSGSRRLHVTANPRHEPGDQTHPASLASRATTESRRPRLARSGPRAHAVRDRYAAEERSAYCPTSHESPRAPRCSLRASPSPPWHAPRIPPRIAAVTIRSGARSRGERPHLRRRARRVLHHECRRDPGGVLRGARRSSFSLWRVVGRARGSGATTRGGR